MARRDKVGTFILRPCRHTETVCSHWSGAEVLFSKSPKYSPRMLESRVRRRPPLRKKWIFLKVVVFVLHDPVEFTLTTFYFFQNTMRANRPTHAALQLWLILLVRRQDGGIFTFAPMLEIIFLSRPNAHDRTRLMHYLVPRRVNTVGL